MSNRQLPEPAEISSLRLAGHWMRHTLTGWLATEVVPVLAGCRLPDRGMEALHGASRLWAADLEVTIGVPNHTYAESIRISTLPYFQSAYMCMQHNKWSKIKVFGNCPNLWVLETVWPETVSQLGRTAAWTGCKTCIVLQPKFLFYVWKSGNRPDANNTKDNAMIGLIGCSVIVLQSQRSPHRTYILGKTLGCLHEIEATTPGKRIQMQKWTARFAACGNNKGFSCVTAGQRFIDYWICFIISCQKCGKNWGLQRVRAMWKSCTCLSHSTSALGHRPLCYPRSLDFDLTAN